MPRKTRGPGSTGDWAKLAIDYRTRAARLEAGQERDSLQQRANLLDSAMKMQDWLRPTRAGSGKLQRR